MKRAVVTFAVLSCVLLAGWLAALFVAVEPSDLPLEARLMERYAREVAAAEQTLMAAEKRAERDDAALIGPLMGLAEVHHGFRQDSRAVQPLQRALAIQEKALGKDHTGLTQVLTRLANSYYLARPRDKTRAEALYQRTVAITEKAHGPEHIEVGHRLFALARFYENEKDYARARIHYARRLAIVEKAFGPEHRSTAATLSSLGTISLREENYLEAELLLKRALAILEKDNDPSYYAFNLERLAEVYAATGRARESDELRARAANMRKS